MIPAFEELSPFKSTDYPKKCVENLIFFNQKTETFNLKKSVYSISVIANLIINAMFFAAFYFIPFSDDERVVLFDTMFLSGQPKALGLLTMFIVLTAIHTFIDAHFRFNSHILGILRRMIVKWDKRLFPFRTYLGQDIIEYAKKKFYQMFWSIQSIVVILGK